MCDLVALSLVWAEHVYTDTHLTIFSKAVHLPPGCYKINLIYVKLPEIPQNDWRWESHVAYLKL